MEFEVIGDADAGPTLRLDYRSFAYAGKFVMSNTGKAVARADGEVIAAAAFNGDRTDPDAAWVRYVTVREDRRGEGVGSRLLGRVAAHLHDRYGTVRIAVNNPFAYEAAYRAGFGYADERTGLAELVCVHPAPDPSPERYRAGLDVYRDRDLTDAERSFLDGREAPPDRVPDAAR